MLTFSVLPWVQGRKYCHEICVCVWEGSYENSDALLKKKITSIALRSNVRWTVFVAVVTRVIYY
jgi:hypothetical protein